ncbi:hypothetical protein LA080_002681 [Diaporthe eres]|nr:hypothetical protein LA080_002681 [Diaporthe eres]
MPSLLFAKALPTDGALHSLLSGVVFRPSPMQLPANPSSTQGLSARHKSSAKLIQVKPSPPLAPIPQPPQVSIDKIAFANPQLDRHSGEAVGSLRSGNSGEMSLSCTVATTRDDESLTPRVVPVLRNTLG